MTSENILRVFFGTAPAWLALSGFAMAEDSYPEMGGRR